ncbi:MAG: hypothetical protein GY789_10145 [Hyphomicrobiales bacterium]|nr:hypothetical protein [Hyphomicrobiales bacterium]
MGDINFEDQGLTVLAVIQDDVRLSPHPLRKVRQNSKIIVKGTEDALLQSRSDKAFAIEPDIRFMDADLARDDLAIGEAVLVPQSRLVGKTLRQIEFYHRYGLIALAIYRRGHAYPARIGNMRLKVGDVMLLQGPGDELKRLKGNLNLWGLSQVESHVPTKRHGLIALAALALAILFGSAGFIPLSIALLIAVVVLVVTGCATMSDAYSMIEWRLLVLIAGLTSFGPAMQKTGTADFLAGYIAIATTSLGFYATLAAFSLLTVLLTQPLSNVAAALAVLPVAIATADLLHVDPRSMALFVTLSASLSFITPFEPASLMVYGPGKYRFMDFVKCGLPLTILMAAILIFLFPEFWSF